MKKLLLLLLLITASCSTDDMDADCECIKSVYDIEQSVITNPVTGLPQLSFEHIQISSDAVECQEEGLFDLDGNMYYTISCN